MFGPNQFVNYPGTERRQFLLSVPRPVVFQQESGYNSIRIKTLYSTSAATSEQWQWIQNTLMPKTVAYIAASLKVVPVSGKLYIGRTCTSYFITDGNCASAQHESLEVCGHNYVNSADLDSLTIYSSGTATTGSTYPAGSGGYDGYDFILYVSADAAADICIDSSGAARNVAAYAGACRYDQYDRPTAGFVNFCPSKIDMTEEKIAEQWSTGVHEILHALGFISSRYAYFWNHGDGYPTTPRCSKNVVYPSGLPCAGDTFQANAASNFLQNFPAGTIHKPATSTLQSFTERGSTVWKITSATAVDKARTHFGCTTLNGVELENEGGSGTAGSHWEQRIYQQEVMTGVGRMNPVLTEITLALFQDTGWYHVDYAKASVLLWGKGAGCDFATSKCLTAGNPPTAVSGSTTEWCTTSVQGCSLESGNVAVGLCGLTEHTTALDSAYQYFTSNPAQGGNGATMDYCPYVRPYSDLDCRYTANSPTINYYGDLMATYSTCFETTLLKTGSTLSSPRRHACYTPRCTTSKLYLTLACAAGANCTTTEVECPTAGGPS